MEATQQQDLTLISDIVTRLNQRRVELSKAEEDLQKALNGKEHTEKQTNNLREEERKLLEKIGLLNLLWESKKREFTYLSTRVIDKELHILQSKNLTSAEKNKLDYIYELRKASSEDLIRLNNEIIASEKKRSHKEHEVNLAEKNLDLAKKKIETTQKDVDSKLLELSRRESEVDNRERGLQTTLEYLERTKQRLQQFINENNLDITL